MRQEQPRAATGKRLRAAAAVRAGGGQQAASNEEQAASDPSRSSLLEEKQRQQVAPTSKNAVSPARSRAERPRDLNIEENPRAAVTSSAGAACLDLQEEASKVDFCSMKCNRERVAQWRNEKRLQKQPHDFERLEAEIHGTATKKPPTARNHDTATQNRRAPGGNRARDHPLQRRRQDH